eukprot:gnl/MRDRNA2_/MRDRNA2_67370_c0_seq1.p1 gnl/MRDRNA2_/MRDRNA2_67370_c0~~gnl/MRDRNA2_/MRDRNA2_67370_c0_seq1.p1  ORF type:complete len:446 (+),score=82.53 gnl/MRDRNA2_/MRDRNA2_67370_c0_seq1:62-1399(+)
MKALDAQTEGQAQAARHSAPGTHDAGSRWMLKEQRNDQRQSDELSNSIRSMVLKDLSKKRSNSARSWRSNSARSVGSSTGGRSLQTSRSSCSLRKIEANAQTLMLAGRVYLAERALELEKAKVEEATAKKKKGQGLKTFQKNVAGHQKDHTDDCKVCSFQPELQGELEHFEQLRQENLAFKRHIVELQRQNQSIQQQKRSTEMALEEVLDKNHKLAGIARREGLGMITNSAIKCQASGKILEDVAVVKQKLEVLACELESCTALPNVARGETLDEKRTVPNDQCDDSAETFDFSMSDVVWAPSPWKHQQAGACEGFDRNMPMSATPNFGQNGRKYQTTRLSSSGSSSYQSPRRIISAELANELEHETAPSVAVSDSIYSPLKFQLQEDASSSQAKYVPVERLEPEERSAYSEGTGETDGRCFARTGKGGTAASEEPYTAFFFQFL